MKKKLTLIATAVALGALVVVGATMAYFTSQDTATNVVTTGNVKIEIQESTTDTNGAIKGEQKEVNGDITYSNITPGSRLSKVVDVKNTGSNDAFIRVKVDMIYEDKDGVKQTVAEDMEATPNFDTENWTAKVEDGVTYYYYNTKLAADATTVTPLFTEITIPGKTWKNEQKNWTVKAVVTAEAVQADNFVQDLNEARPWGTVEIETTAAETTEVETTTAPVVE